MYTVKRIQFVSQVSVLSIRSAVVNKRENPTVNLIYIYIFYLIRSITQK